MSDRPTRTGLNPAPSRPIIGGSWPGLTALTPLQPPPRLPHLQRQVDFRWDYDCSQGSQFIDSISIHSFLYYCVSTSLCKWTFCFQCDALSNHGHSVSNASPPTNIDMIMQPLRQMSPNSTNMLILARFRLVRGGYAQPDIQFHSSKFNLPNSLP